MSVHGLYQVFPLCNSVILVVRSLSQAISQYNLSNEYIRDSLNCNVAWLHMRCWQPHGTSFITCFTSIYFKKSNNYIKKINLFFYFRKILEDNHVLWKSEYAKESDKELMRILFRHINGISNEQGKNLTAVVSAWHLVYFTLNQQINGQIVLIKQIIAGNRGAIFLCQQVNPTIGQLKSAKTLNVRCRINFQWYCIIF